MFTTTKSWRLTPPDLVEERGELVLLVWGSLPYWSVVDREFHALLRALDGRGLDEVLTDNPAWRGQRREIEGQLAVLRTAGVFGGPEEKTPAPPLYGTKIENIALNLTRRCNLRCRFCYNLPYLTKDGAGEISSEEIGGYLRALKPFQAKHPTFTVLGGEPLLEAEKLLAVCEMAIRQGCTALVSTNGTEVTDDFARRAATLGLQVQVSLDGHTAKLNDAVRGKGAFDRAVAGIRRLVAQGAHTIISQVCHRGNLPHLGAYYRFGLSLGVNEVRFIPLKCLGGAAAGEFAPVPLDELLKHAFALFKAHPEFLPLAGRDAFSILATTCRFSSRRPSCGTGLQTLLLDADGTLYPCLNTNHPAFRIANLREPGFDFKRTWLESPVLNDLRQRTVLFNPSEHSGCPVRYWCLGGCRGENHAVTGDAGKRSPDCASLRRGILEMFWMLAERPDLAKPAVKSC
ncbi:MAG: radical SAM protein [Armatimonadota bacterium]